MGCGSSSPVSEWDAALPPPKEAPKEAPKVGFKVRVSNGAPKEAPKEAPIPTKEWAGDDEYNSLLADAKAFEATGDKTNEDYYHDLRWKYEDVKDYMLSDDAGYQWKAVIPIAEKLVETFKHWVDHPDPNWEDPADELSGATLGYAESIAEVGQCNAQVQQWGPCTAWFKRAIGVLKDYTPHGDEHAARRDELVAEYQELVKMSDGFAASPSAFPALYRGDDATGVE
jgi:hypothetical protein